MSDDKSARSEKKTEEETCRISSEEAKPSGSAEMLRKDIYSRFVNSFESADKHCEQCGLSKLRETLFGKVQT
ncbi:hypothetical protein KIN20_025957 [Parelaphostrongylus tenuis]|uniref:Uncharacterized protein n=1 Tax=Parelaphostrongylus tenuis TaxID=148309 RepID=A0AAD5MW17_PARTN|nr:hypothetical protein KIN20_021597 [Parelaphostrongylus tenuis]KAJ1365580.1 hypothetical protein KIN20_025957 [Parelaphostrongylus tenuis]